MDDYSAPRQQFEPCAGGPYHLREGFMLYWYRSSQKKKRDQRDRDESRADERAAGERLTLDACGSQDGRCDWQPRR